MKLAHTLARLQLSLLSGVAFLSIASAASAQAVKEGTETKVVPQQQPPTLDVKTPAPIQNAVKTPFDPSSINVQTPQDVLPPKNRSSAPASKILSADRFAQPFYDVVDGSIWVRGATYKAEFSPSGATYIPFFGSAAPQNYPVSMSVLDARVGGQLLPMLTAPAQRAGDIVEYAHGSFIERYQIGTHSIEQLFVFDGLPAAGDLVVRVGFQTELQAQPTADGLRFGNALGYVSYSNAILVDADGQRTAIPGEWIDGGLELRVAASDLATAAFPITIDPVVSTFAIDGAAVDQFTADAAYTATAALYCVLYEEAFSATDHDVRGETLNTTGGQVSAGYFDFTTSYWADPKVASNPLANNYLAVAGRGSVTGGAREIWGRIGSSTLVFGAQFRIDSSATTGDKHHPDVGGDPVLFGPTYYTVVWERDLTAADTDIHAQQVNSNGTLFGSLILVDNTGATLDRFPSISKSDGKAPFGTQNWHIVWQRDFTPTDHDIYGAEILWSGTLTQGTYLIDFSGADDLRPRVSSQLDAPVGNRDALVVYQRGAGTAFDIIGSVVNNGVVVDYANNISAFGTFGGENNIEPAVDSDGARFTVAYSESFLGSSIDHDIYVDSLTYTGGNLIACELHQNLAFTSATERDPGITSTYSGNGAATRFQAAWDTRFSPTDRDIDGGLYDAICGPPPTPPSNDDCSTPIRLLGQGTHPFDTANATTSTQQSTLCPTANRDIWFLYLATRSGTATATTCALATTDSVLAVYLGPGCPTGPELACNDDDFTCGLQSTITWPTVCGQLYLIQVGAFGTTTTYAGSLNISETGAGCPATAFCFGSVANCPCGNAGAPTNGCANSSNAGGGNLSATGTASISADTLTLVGSGMVTFAPTSYFQGTSQGGANFGDGRRCADGSIIRLGRKFNSGGASSYPGLGDTPISIKGMVVAGNSRTYQAIYRDAVAAFCPPLTWNTTNGLIIAWQP